MKVTNMLSPKGKKVPNQYIIEDGNVITFQSYDSKIATYDKGDKSFLIYPDWERSKTTLRYFKQFVNEHTIGSNVGYESKSQFLRDCDLYPHLYIFM